MKIIGCPKYGSAEVLSVVDRPVPLAGKNEVLVKVYAASVNPVDWEIRSGALKIKTGFKPPEILGSDFAGVIQAVGSQVNEYLVGDEVWGKFDSFKGGSYAQMVVAKEQNISLKPQNIDFLHAAAVPNVALTAYQALVKKAGLKRGQSVMVNGASGGVGMMAVQMAKALDCHVTAVCSGKNMSMVQSLGADVVLDYNQDDILKPNNAYDVFFDCVSNQSFFKVRATLRSAGTHVKTTPDLISALGGLIKPFKVKRPDHIMVKPNNKDLKQIKAWVESEQLKPMVQQVYSMAEIVQAHQQSQTGRVVGKLVLDMQG
ncbi:NAD(P)-dependent alcohol dehydrogenase [Marinicella litoralis]|uniref:NADPH:quinone reductase-like Zn-dependent oxidoreductase n=1 Tax=Marinicella litoralis TaxID=644220 RepID=A0A4R6XZR3_9GAMM|nr:NAD(P)-dependent alcohol dehydrogenase [Marinicella litoralis]TDR23293.1 NADPH:quinone reductase-like Zn-dependent oxidoreductase [Marinicella litoralis]